MQEHGDTTKQSLLVEMANTAENRLRMRRAHEGSLLAMWILRYEGLRVSFGEGTPGINKPGEKGVIRVEAEVKEFPRQEVVNRPKK